MKLIDSREFDKNYPEEYNWGMVSTLSLSELGHQIARKVKYDLTLPPDERWAVGGLRLALVMIARQANVDE